MNNFEMNESQTILKIIAYFAIFHIVNDKNLIILKA